MPPWPIISTISRFGKAGASCSSENWSRHFGQTPPNSRSVSSAAGALQRGQFIVVHLRRYLRKRRTDVSRKRGEKFADFRIDPLGAIDRREDLPAETLAEPGAEAEEAVLPVGDAQVGPRLSAQQREVVRRHLQPELGHGPGEDFLRPAAPERLLGRGGRV